MKKILSVLFAAALCVASVSASADLADIYYGDINNDLTADNLDAAVVLKYDAGLEDLGDYGQLIGDVNLDGVMDNLDAALILKYDAGLIEKLGPTEYKLTEEKTNYALGKSYELNGETIDSGIYLGIDKGDLSWADTELTMMTDGIVGDITASDYKSGYAAKTGVSVLLAGTNRLREYIIDLGDHYGDINKIVFRNVRNSMPYGGNRGFKLRLAYVSDNGSDWYKITSSVEALPVEGAPEVADIGGTGVQHFDYVATLDEPAQGRFLRLILFSDGGYVIQLEEIEVWNK